ncbi:hypothetical protein FRC16_010878 [Serendipita sp. 398]|nr:hypothetical protein FRC16_010878 [Serendipita sp. 398]
MPLAIPYSDFQHQSGTLVNGGGPWNVYTSGEDVNCGSSQAPWCKDAGNCLFCWILPTSSKDDYTVWFTVNVSVPMEQYGNVDSLSYEFSYSVDWASSKIARGYPLTSYLLVGRNNFSDSFLADDYEELLHTRQTWAGEPLRYSGTTDLDKYRDQSTGYINIHTYMMFPGGPSANINYYMKGATLKITTPTSETQLPSPISSGSSTSSTSLSQSMPNALSTSPSFLPTTLVPYHTPGLSEPGGDASSTSIPSTSSSVSSPTEKMPPVAIAGIALGAVAVIGIFIFLFLCYRRTRQRGEEGDNIPLRGTASVVDQPRFWATPNSGSNTLALPYIVPPNQQSAETLQSSLRPSSNSIPQQVQDQTQSRHHNVDETYPGANLQRGISVLGTQLEMEVPPPAYTAHGTPAADAPLYDQPLIVCNPPSSPSMTESGPTVTYPSSLGGTSISDLGEVSVDAAISLSRWARDNRAYITEKLERKLNAAGYSPIDGPDNISEEVWRSKWGVTEFELKKMRALYARTRAQISD